MEKFVNKYDTNSSVNDMWKTIEQDLSEILNMVPSKLTTSRFNQPWVNRQIKCLAKQKQRAYNKACFSHHCHKARLWGRYNQLKKRMQKACNAAYADYINSIICPDLQSNPKRFWSHIASK